MRVPIIAGNWKMNTTARDAINLARGVTELSGDMTGVEIVLCPPFTSLAAVQSVVEGTPVKLGAQNLHWEPKGAYTGEIAPTMLLTLGCSHVILGHSERRSYFHEDDEIVARKVQAALAAGLTPIVCVGETREERESGKTERVVDTQVRGAFQGLDAATFVGTVIAYEPVWAIGTGLTATTAQAQDVHHLIRRILEELFGKEVASATRIQYGGSMKASNARELLEQPDIDGGLIGGASLNAEDFIAIVRSALP